MTEAARPTPPYGARLETLAPLSLPDWASERRKRLAGRAVALACEDVHKDTEAARRLMLPHDAPEPARVYLPKRSTCALFARGYLSLVGAEHPCLDVPYLPRDGRAVSDVVAIGRDAGAWRMPSADVLPLTGDVVLMGRALPNGAPDPAWVRGTKATEHVLVVTDVSSGLGANEEIYSVDGGQPGVERRTRGIVRAGAQGRELWLASLPLGRDGKPTGAAPAPTADGRPAVGRRVVGWVCIGDLPTTREAFVPESIDLTTALFDQPRPCAIFNSATAPAANRPAT